jgi:hypothetical protein
MVKSFKLEKGTIPIEWVFGLLAFVGSGIWATAFWVSGVNTNVSELKSDMKLVKRKLNIEGVSTDEVSTLSFIVDAEACNVDGK